MSERQENANRVFDMLSAAAVQGLPCPTNQQIAIGLGMTGLATGATYVKFLETAGRIRVTRYLRDRVVEIVATGKKTATPVGTSPRPPSGVWAGKDDMLREYWNAGMTASEIAGHFGVTKSSVIARAHRIGLPGRDSSVRITARRLLHRKAARAEAAQRMAAIRERIESAIQPKPAAAVRAAAAPIGSGQCRWPMWDDHEAPTHAYCGCAAVEGKPYCLDHMAIAYIPKHSKAYREQLQALSAYPGKIGADTAHAIAQS